MRVSHISWNLVGLGLPLLIAAVTIPHLLVALGNQRFGLLTLAWGLIGYASALDLGVGRAATHRISELKAGRDSERSGIPVVLSTAVRVTVITGGIAAALILISLALGVDRLLKADQVPATEIRWAIACLAIALPLQAISAAYRGVNEAYLNFRGISILRILLGAANFGLPFLIALVSQSVYWLVLSLVISRALALWVFRSLAFACMHKDGLKPATQYSREEARRLMRFGGWFTLSSVLNPAVASADRFYIASVISAAAAASYVIPYEMVAQSLILVGAVTTVAFPYLSQIRVADPEGAQRIYRRMLGISLGAMAVVTAFFLILGATVLSLWLGKSIPLEAHSVIRILSLGLVPYTLGTMCVALLHSAGKTDVTAKVNIVEFPVFLALIYLMVSHFGIVGAAYAWVIRVTLDAFVLMLCARRVI